MESSNDREKVRESFLESSPELSVIHPCSLYLPLAEAFAWAAIIIQPLYHVHMDTHNHIHYQSSADGLSGIKTKQQI